MSRHSETRVSQVQARYEESTLDKHTFFAASQAVATTSVGLTTAYTGLVVSNPVGSSRRLVLLKASIMQSVIQATQVEGYALAVGYHASTNVTHTAAASIYSGFIDNAPATNQSIATADTSATLPTAPVYAHFLTNTAAASTNAAGITVDFEGSIILGPGAYACFVTPTQASVAGLWFSLSWSERRFVV